MEAFIARRHIPLTLLVDMFIVTIAWFVILVNDVNGGVDTRVRDHHGSVICKEAGC